jgi:ATP-dependent Clp protease adaptor protein ClpS
MSKNINDFKSDINTDTDELVSSKMKTKKPSKYKVVLLNDDYTPMEFVVKVLIVFFSKNEEEAMKIMLHIHQKGLGLCGFYSFDIAETKVTQVMAYSIKHNHPLQCKMEKG